MSGLVDRLRRRGRLSAAGIPVACRGMPLRTDVLGVRAACASRARLIRGTGVGVLPSSSAVIPFNPGGYDPSTSQGEARQRDDGAARISGRRP